MPVHRRPLVLQAPLKPDQERLKQQDCRACAYVFNVVVVVAMSYLCFVGLSEERAEWEERRGGKAPPQRPRKDVLASHMYLVCRSLDGM